MVAELAARTVLPAPWYLSSTSSTEQDAPIANPVRHDRRPLKATPTNPGTYRILFLGDSFTYGRGVADESRIFTRGIEALLNEQRPDPRYSEYVSFNASFPGSLTSDWLQLFEIWAPVLKPDLVVAVFFLRDGQTRALSISEIQNIRQDLSRLYDSSFWFRHSALYRYFRELVEQRKLGAEYLRNMAIGYFGDAEETEEWKRAQLNLLKIRRDTESRGAQFALVVFPVLFGLDDDYPLRDVVDEIERFAGDFDIPVFSLLPAFLNRRAEELWVSVTDQHPNEAGHEIAARAMMPFLVDAIRGTTTASVSWNETDAPVSAGVKRKTWGLADPELDAGIRRLAAAQTEKEVRGAQQALAKYGKRAHRRLQQLLQPQPCRICASRLDPGRTKPLHC